MTQNATQQVAATDGTEQKPMLKDGSFAEELPLDAAARHSVLREEVPPQGLEQLLFSPRNRHISDQGEAPGRSSVCNLAPDLQSIIDAWPNLTDEQKAAILVIIDKSVTSQDDAVHE